MGYDMNTKRETFHLPRELYTSMDIDETVEFQFGEDEKKEYQNARNQTYRFNMWFLRDHKERGVPLLKFSLSRKVKTGYLIITRII